VDFKLELVVVPVSDVDRAKAFYADKMGFTVDVDHAPNEHFRVVQLTPPGSSCSITIGTGLTKSEPGTYQGLHLVVTDIEAARAELIGRGVDVGEIQDVGGGVQYAGFEDPDGNSLTLQLMPWRTGDAF
jgi:catechol 2,3-dioxygenase-like lactoylglutathione lyase family enzyme